MFEQWFSKQDLQQIEPQNSGSTRGLDLHEIFYVFFTTQIYSTRSKLVPTYDLKVILKGVYLNCDKTYQFGDEIMGFKLGGKLDDNMINVLNRLSVDYFNEVEEIINEKNAIQTLYYQTIVAAAPLFEKNRRSLSILYNFNSIICFVRN